MPDQLRLDGVSKSTVIALAGGTTSLPGTSLPGRQRVIISNGGTDTVWIGDSTVTSSNGIPIGTGSPVFPLPLELANAKVYAVGGTAGTVRVLEIS